MPDSYAATLAEYTAAKAEYGRLKQQAERPLYRSKRSSLQPPEPRFFLTSRRGPACFIIVDGSRASFTVNIGERHACTCSGASSSNSQCCEHVRWVLTRCLQIKDRAMASATGIPEPGLSRILEQATVAQPITRRRAPPARQLHEQSVRFLKGLSEEDAWLLAQPLFNSGDDDKAAEGSKARRHPEEDETCAVCMESMNDPSMLVWCDRGCGRPLHRECLRIWAQHQTDGPSGPNPTCPMCRAPWSAVDTRSASEVAKAAAITERQRSLRRGLAQVAERDAWDEVARRRAATEPPSTHLDQRHDPDGAQVAGDAKDHRPTASAAAIASQASTAQRTVLVSRLAPGHGAGRQDHAPASAVALDDSEYGRGAGWAAPPPRTFCAGTSLPPHGRPRRPMLQIGGTASIRTRTSAHNMYM